MDTTQQCQAHHKKPGEAKPCMLYSCCSRLQLSFSENGHWSSSEEKEKVAETDDTCYGKEIGFGSQSMKIAEASSRASPRFFEIVVEIERCFRYHAFPQDRTAIKAG